MELLDKYKKAWNNQPEEKNKVSAQDIYRISHANSSSIVKWIFVIGILEFLFWGIINVSIPDSFYEIYKELNLETFLQVFTIIHYIVLVAFLYLFYKNHKRISVTENTKKLIQKILKVRKTVNSYVYYNLAIIILIGVVLNVKTISNINENGNILIPENLSMDLSEIISVTILIQLITLIIIFVFFWLFYKLLYGIFLKKLNKNYKELIKLES